MRRASPATRRRSPPPIRIWRRWRDQTNKRAPLPTCRFASRKRLCCARLQNRSSNRYAKRRAQAPPLSRLSGARAPRPRCRMRLRRQPWESITLVIFNSAMMFIRSSEKRGERTQTIGRALLARLGSMRPAHVERRRASTNLAFWKRLATPSACLGLLRFPREETQKNDLCEMDPLLAARPANAYCPAGAFYRARDAIRPLLALSVIHGAPTHFRSQRASCHTKVHDGAGEGDPSLSCETPPWISRLARSGRSLGQPRVGRQLFLADIQAPLDPSRLH